MEGLIPFLVHAIKRQKLHQHKHNYRCQSDGSKQSYQLLASAGNSFSGSSHRRTQSEFVAPALMDLQPQVEEFVRSRSYKSSINDTKNGLRETHRRVAALNNYDYNNYGQAGSKGIMHQHKS